VGDFFEVCDTAHTARAESLAAMPLHGVKALFFEAQGQLFGCSFHSVIAITFCGSDETSAVLRRQIHLAENLLVPGIALNNAHSRIRRRIS
jgi:hypothetical protein